jgi:hypothetical protein
MIPVIAAAINDPSRRAPQRSLSVKGGQWGGPRPVMNEFSGDINGLMTFW